jgi:glutaredoxin 3
MEVVVWSKYHCANCDQAKSLLQSKGIEFEERKLGDGYTKEELLEQIPNAKSLPQIVINGELIGGIINLREYFKKENHVN